MFESIILYCPNCGEREFTNVDSCVYPEKNVIQEVWYCSICGHEKIEELPINKEVKKQLK